MFKVAKEVIWIKKFINELGVVPSIVNPIAYTMIIIESL